MWNLTARNCFQMGNWKIWPWTPLYLNKSLHLPSTQNYNARSLYKGSIPACVACSFFLRKGTTGMGKRGERLTSQSKRPGYWLKVRSRIFLKSKNSSYKVRLVCGFSICGRSVPGGFINCMLQIGRVVRRLSLLSVSTDWQYFVSTVATPSFVPHLPPHRRLLLSVMVDLQWL